MNKGLPFCKISFRIFNREFPVKIKSNHISFEKNIVIYIIFYVFYYYFYR